MEEILEGLRDSLFENGWDGVRSDLEDYLELSEGASLPLVPNLEDEENPPCFLLFALTDMAPVDILEQLLDLTSEEHLQRSYRGSSTLLHCALRSETSFQITRRIAEAYPLAVVMMDRHGDTPIDDLIRPKENGRLSEEEKARIITMLLELCPAAMYARNSDGDNILHRCMRFCDDDDCPIERALLDAAPHMVLEKNAAGLTSLHVAARLQSDDRIHLLDEKLACACPWKDVDSKGRTPLHHFVLGQTLYLHVCLAIARKNPAVAFMKDEDDNTPLDLFRTLHGDALLGLPSSVEHVDDDRVAGILALLLHCPDFDIHCMLGRERLTMDVFSTLLTFMGTERYLTSFATTYSTLHEKLALPNSDGDLPLHVLCKRNPTIDDQDQYNRAMKLMVDAYPDACSRPDGNGDIPLVILDRVGHGWGHGVKVLVAAFPGAVLDLKIDESSAAWQTLLVNLASKEQDNDAMLLLLQSVSHLIKAMRKDA